MRKAGPVGTAGKQDCGEQGSGRRRQGSVVVRGNRDRLDSSYVGGTEGCIKRILTDAALETFPAQLDDQVDFGADELNV